MSLVMFRVSRGFSLICTLLKMALKELFRNMKATWKVLCYHKKPASLHTFTTKSNIFDTNLPKQPVKQAQSWQTDDSGMQPEDLFLQLFCFFWQSEESCNFPLTAYVLSVQFCCYLLTCLTIPHCVETRSALAPLTPCHQHALLVAIPPRSH